VINPAYIEHPADVAVIAAGIRWFGRVAQSKHLADKSTRPGPEVDLQNLGNAKQAVKDMTMGEYHPYGSCAMGDALDSKLRLKGVDRLRVADASVFPNNISGNICSTVYAVAERAADLIKEDNGLPTV
jgi:choline dehydrogenase-like flavoprotein